MNDRIERLRKHVATYKTMTRHRQDCLDAAVLLEQLLVKAREARISLEHGEWDDAKEALNDILRVSVEVSDDV